MLALSLTIPALLVSNPGKPRNKKNLHYRPRTEPAPKIIQRYTQYPSLLDQLNAYKNIKPTDENIATLLKKADEKKDESKIKECLDFIKSKPELQIGFMDKMMSGDSTLLRLQQIKDKLYLAHYPNTQEKGILEAYIIRTCADRAQAKWYHITPLVVLCLYIGYLETMNNIHYGTCSSTTPDWKQGWE